MTDLSSNPRGRPRHHSYTYDAARRVRLRLVKVQIALRELAYAIGQEPEVAMALLAEKELAMREVADAASTAHRAAYSTLINVLRDAYEQRTGLPQSTYVGGLVARGDLGGLRLSDVPKVFIETANMRSAADARKLESRRFRKRIARGIADGVIRFLSP